VPKPCGWWSATTQVQARVLREGLIVELGGRDDSVVLMLPPLNVTAEVVDMACTILIEAIEYWTPQTGRMLSLVPDPVRAGS
jgi:diaminobutyrate-2-oxoglutarate transaminase